MDFGVLYGRDLAAGLSYGPEAEQIYASMGRYLSNEECTKLQTDFFRAFPSLKTWIDSMHKTVRRDQRVETPLGRRRRFPYLTNQTVNGIERQSVNTMCQSTASDFTLNAIINMTRRLPRDRCVITFTVHDSIAFICRDDYIDEAKIIIREEMEKPPFPAFDVPVKADIGVAKRWGDLSD
jgi:DNA polymerase-1